MIVEVAINVPIRKCFDYCWPEDLDQVPKPGLQVLVPFGRQKKGGVIVGVNKKSKLSELKFIESLVEEKPLFTEEILNLTKWTSEYYFCAWGEVLNAAIPGGISLNMKTSFCPQISPLPGIENLSKNLTKLVGTKNLWTENEWLKCKPDEKDQKIMNQWLNNKDVLKKQILVGKKTKTKMERWVRILKTENLKKPKINRITKRIQILEILNNNSVISWNEIISRVKSPTQTLKKLKEEGLIEIYEKRVYRRFLY